MSPVSIPAGPSAALVESARGPAQGMRIGSYELIRELGRGGMGAVWVARDVKLGRRVAMKFLHTVRVDLKARFIREARATARCSHENIVVIHEVAEHEDEPFMVLELLEGAPLSKLIEPGRRMPAPRAVELMVPVVRALVCAHEQGIVHRDLKPDNVLVTDTGIVKVLDFGIAKLLYEPVDGGAGPRRSLAAELAELGQSDGINTRRGALMGTMPYMSPEQWWGEDVDHRTDVWAAGIILFQMVAGRHPLHPYTGAQYAVTGAYDLPMPGVRDACPDLPDDLAGVIDQCLIKPRDQRLRSARALLDALEPLLPGRQVRPLRADQSPYPGLRAFQKADAHRFFGRTREIAAAAARLREQPLMGVVGPSGVGKSSFVRAGLVPALERSGEPWTTLIVRPGRQPLDALAQLIAPLAGEHTTITTVAGDVADLRAARQRLLGELGWLGAVLRSRAQQRDQRILLFVDQLEELYTLGATPEERRAFTASLASAADDPTTPVRVVVSVRSDFLDRVAEDPHFLSALTRGLFFLTPPGRADLREALTGPAELAGFQLENEAMGEHMLDHLVQVPGALPLLQFAAGRLWDARDRERRLLTEASYRALGGIAGALASHADAVVAELPAQLQQLARSVLLRLVTPERTRAVVPLSELSELGPDAAAVQHLVDHLVSARLLVVQSGDGEAGAGATAEIVHESLIQTWPRLRRWLDENQDDAAFLEQLRTAARQWRARGQRDDLLWRGELAQEARHWARRYRGELPAVQRAYLAAVIRLATRAARRLRWLVAGAMISLIALAAAATVGLVLIRDAQKEAVAQAAVARRAETQVRAQLERVQAEERARREAEARERAAREAAEAAGVQVAHTNEELARRNQELGEALARATEARQRADGSAVAAQAAEAEARRANERLQRLLERERERVRLLEQGGGAMFTQPGDEELIP